MDEVAIKLENAGIIDRRYKENNRNHNTRVLDRLGATSFKK